VAFDFDLGEGSWVGCFVLSGLFRMAGTDLRPFHLANMSRDCTGAAYVTSINQGTVWGHLPPDMQITDYRYGFPTPVCIWFGSGTLVPVWLPGASWMLLAL